MPIDKTCHPRSGAGYPVPRQTSPSAVHGAGYVFVSPISPPLAGLAGPLSVYRLHDLAGANERTYSLIDKGQELPPDEGGQLHALDMKRRPIGRRGRCDVAAHFQDRAPRFIMGVKERVQKAGILPASGRVRCCIAICEHDQRLSPSSCCCRSMCGRLGGLAAMADLGATKPLNDLPFAPTFPIRRGADFPTPLPA